MEQLLPGAWRFHHAVILEALFRLAEGSPEQSLQLACDSRHARLFLLDGAGMTTSAVRAVSADRAYRVLSSDLWRAMREWANRGPRATSFSFLTDGEIFPTAQTIVVDRLERFRQGLETEEDRHVVTVIGLDPGGDLVRSVAIRSRLVPDAVLGGRTLDRLPAAAGRLLVELCTPGSHPGSEVTVTAGQVLEAMRRPGEQTSSAPKAAVDGEGLAGGCEKGLHQRLTKGAVTAGLTDRSFQGGWDVW